MLLFLEFAEINSSALEALRTPVEDGEIRLARRDGVARYLCRFQLVLAANLCPCAPPDPRDCECGAAERRRYRSKLSGPLVDRVDLRVEMHTSKAGTFTDEQGESTSVVRERVWAARRAAEERWRPYGFATNAEVSGSLLRRRFRLSPDAIKPLRSAVDRGAVSARGMDRTLRVAWSLCDLAGRAVPKKDDVETAMSFRQVGG